MADDRAAKAAQKVSPEERAQMLDRYARGQSTKTIGFAMSRAAGTVSAVLKEAGALRSSTETWAGMNSKLRPRGSKGRQVLVPFRRAS